MIYYLDQFVTGPFKNETPFQNAATAKLKAIWPADSFFHIETEETEPGFPDTIRVSTVRSSLQIEYKVSDAKGVIHFKKSQPLWYRRHMDLTVVILAWDQRVDRTMLITHDEIVNAATLHFRLPNPTETPTFRFTAYERRNAT